MQCCGCRSQSTLGSRKQTVSSIKSKYENEDDVASIGPGQAKLYIWTCSMQPMV